MNPEPRGSISHFDEMTCLLYLDGQLDALRAGELRRHVASCSECRTLLRALERESSLLREALTEENESVPARLLAAPGREGAPWGWILSFGLAGMGFYVLWTGVETFMAQLDQAGYGVTGLMTILFFSGAFWKGWGGIMTALQYFGLATLLAIGLPFLRRSIRRWKPVALVMCGLAGMLLLPATASAAEIRSAQNFTLSAKETIKNDLIVFCGVARIEGNVEGDLIVFSQSLTVTGHVTGDVIAFGKRVSIEGQVDGDVRSFSQSLDLKGPVAKNFTGFAESFEQGSSSRIDGGAILFAESGTFNGRLGRDLLAHIARANLNGYIGGDVKMHADKHVSIGETAEIAGHIRVEGREEPEVAPGAKLAHPLEFKRPVRKARFTRPDFYIGQVVRLGVSFVFGLVIVLMMPAFFAEIVRSTQRYGPALGLGLVSLVSVPALALIACITIVGIAVGISAVLMYLVALYSAKIIVGTWIGEKVLGRSGSVGATLLRMALGLAVLRVLAALPYGGWLVFAYVIWGLGAITLAVYNRVRPAVPAAA